MLYDGLLPGRYKLLQRIGSAGMSNVYLAEDIGTRRQVAIKILQSEVTRDSGITGEAVHHFPFKIEVIDELDHPHILPLFDFGSENVKGITFTYIVMPFRKEGSLADWLKRRNSAEMLAAEDVGHFLNQAADALQHAHDHQLIHQNVKPSNFMVISRKENPNRPDLFLSDFRVANFPAATASGEESIWGTPAYMAPEKWSGQPVAATDQYALAIMAYKLLTGQLPFQGTAGEVRNQHLSAEPKPPSILNSNLPRALDAVILQALAKKPANRFSSVLAFTAAFQQALSSESTGKSSTQPARPFVNTQPVVFTSAPLPPPIDTRILSSTGTQIDGTGRGFGRSTLLLLMALIIVLGVGSLGFLYTMIASHGASGRIAANALVISTKNSNVLLSYPFSNRVGLNDPLSANGKGRIWEVNNENNGTCAFNGGSYHVSKSQQGFHTCLLTSSMFRDFTYEVQMTILKGDCGGIVFRANGSKLYYYSICKDGSYVSVRYLGDYQHPPYEILISNTAPAIHTGLNVINVIGIVAHLNKLDLYVNRQLIISVYDSAFKQGEIGLVAKDMKSPTEVSFTNAKVWIL